VVPLEIKSVLQVAVWLAVQLVASQDRQVLQLAVLSEGKSVVLPVKRLDRSLVKRSVDDLVLAFNKVSKLAVKEDFKGL